MSMFSLWVGLLAQAGAGTAVVHDHSDQTDVLRRVSTRTAVPMEQLEAIHIDQLVSRPPTISGEGSIRHCAGQTISGADLRALQLRAEAAWRNEHFQDARDQLDLGISQLGCLRDRVDRKTATRMFLLRTGMFARAGDTEGALQEALTAIALTPDIRWDDTLPSEGKAVLTKARETTEDAHLSVVPAVSTPPWIDGAPLPSGAPLARRAGLHLLQVPATSGLQTAWLTLEGDAVLVVPAAYRAPVLDRMVDEDPALLHLLEATVGRAPTYVVTDDGIWLVTHADGSPSVEVLVQPAVVEPPPTDEPRSKKKRRR